MNIRHLPTKIKKKFNKIKIKKIKKGNASGLCLHVVHSG